MFAVLVPVFLQLPRRAVKHRRDAGEAFDVDDFDIHDASMRLKDRQQGKRM